MDERRCRPRTAGGEASGDSAPAASQHASPVAAPALALFLNVAPSSSPRTRAPWPSGAALGRRRACSSVHLDQCRRALAVDRFRRRRRPSWPASDRPRRGRGPRCASYYANAPVARRHDRDRRRCSSDRSWSRGDSTLLAWLLDARDTRRAPLGHAYRRFRSPRRRQSRDSTSSPLRFRRWPTPAPRGRLSVDDSPKWLEAIAMANAWFDGDNDAKVP